MKSHNCQNSRAVKEIRGCFQKKNEEVLYQGIMLHGRPAKIGTFILKNHQKNISGLVGKWAFSEYCKIFAKFC